jgi:hypothetical protein
MGPILAGVAAGVIFLAALLFGIWLFLRRRKAGASSNKRKSTRTPPTPALPLQFGPGSSPIDTEKGLAGRPTMLVPTYAAPTFSSPTPPSKPTAQFQQPIHERKDSGLSGMSRGSVDTSDDAPLISHNLSASNKAYALPRQPPVTATRSMPSRAGTPEMSQLPNVPTAMGGGLPAGPGRSVRPMVSNRSLNAVCTIHITGVINYSLTICHIQGGAGPFRPSRPPSLQLTAIDIQAPDAPQAAAAPKRPARPDHPHLSVLHDRRVPAIQAPPQFPMPARPSRPSSPHLSEVDQPVPSNGNRLGVPARPTRPDSFGIVDLYSDGR